jgi:surface antigen
VARRRIAAVGAAAIAGAAAAGGGAGAIAPFPVTVGYTYAAACPAAGYADGVDDWGMYECNCTSYAAWALARNSQRVDWFVAGRMDARNWPSVARAHGIATGSAARVGAIAVWRYAAPPYGHLAYVDAVSADGRFFVAEYNLLRRYSFDRRGWLSPRGVVFVYVPYGRGSG